ncbi:MAG: VanW family protein [Clostridia bacterium]|jgi:vancomycin resistance protein YoaR|nr:VanW family protein [Clostridia bacterium]
MASPYTDRSHRESPVDYLNNRKSTSAQKQASEATRQVPKPTTAVTARTSSGSRTKRRNNKRRKQQRTLLFAVLFLLFAVVILVTSVVIALRLSKNGTGCAAVPAASALPTALPTAVAATPEPVTDATVIQKNITINGVAVQGKTVAAARTAVEQAIEEQMRNLAVTVAYGQYSMVLTAEKIGMFYDPDALDRTLEEAAQLQDAATLVVPLEHDEALLRTSLSELNDQLPNHAQNAEARVLWRENKIKSSGEVYLQPYFDFVEGVNGMAVDSQSVLEQVEEALTSGNFNAEIRPEVTISEPPVTVATLKEQYSLRGSFVTTYRFRGTSSMDETSVLNCESRDTNISKAVNLMRVIELNPGQTFSYNKATGSRTEKNGWALANAIYQGSHRPEPGGGVCQLSTTMYNALLLANVKITARRAHSMQVDYVPDGWDATVDDGHIDFKFQNNTGSKLFVFCYITRNAESSRKKDIHVEVYGKAFPEGTEYRKRTELVEILPIEEEIIKDKTMYVGDKQIIDRVGKEGKIVNTFIDCYVNGKLDKTVYSTTTTYEMITKQIRVGTRPDPTVAPTATPKATPEPTDSGEFWE